MIDAMAWSAGWAFSTASARFLAALTSIADLAMTAPNWTPAESGADTPPGTNDATLVTVSPRAWVLAAALLAASAMLARESEYSTSASMAESLVFQASSSWRAGCSGEVVARG